MILAVSLHEMKICTPRPPFPFVFLCALVHLAVCVCKCEKSLVMAVFNGYLSKSLAMRIGIRVTVRPFLFVALQGCVFVCVCVCL